MQNVGKNVGKEESKAEMRKAYLARSERLTQENLTLRQENERVYVENRGLTDRLLVKDQELKEQDEEISRLRAKVELQASELQKFPLRTRLEVGVEAVIAKRQAEREAILDFSELPVADLIEVYRRVSRKVAERKARVVVIAMESAGFSRYEVASSARWLLGALEKFSISKTEAHLVGKMAQGGDVAAIAECELVLQDMARRPTFSEKVLEGGMASA
jgi:hypothetical protein